MATAEEVDWSAARLECDIVMKGGVTSGVIYPWAITEFAKTYRLRGVGGASAGAIGAALGAAAEFGRESGGFDRLGEVPGNLGGGKLEALFQPQPSTATLLLIMKAGMVPGSPRAKVMAVLRSLRASFPLSAVAGSAPGAIVIFTGLLAGAGIATALHFAAGLVVGGIVVLAGIALLAIGWLSAMALRVADALTQAVPRNLFGICRGLSTGADTGPGLTDWLSERIDYVAGLEGTGPLTFGDLRHGKRRDVNEGDPGFPLVDLRMMSTCLSRTRPYEMPWEAREFFYDREVWGTLFPKYVIDALAAHPAAVPSDYTKAEAAAWTWIDERAATHGLLRLPAVDDLPVVVATRLSLSFPLLISAIPMKSVSFRSPRTRAALAAWRKSGNLPDGVDLEFETLWFTDGGLCRNFPLHLFDAPLPVRPTFAINLGALPKGQEPSGSQIENIEWARDNSSGLLPPHRNIAGHGVAAVTDFALSAVETARSSQDNAYLEVPGYRDRVVRVLQSAKEGGLNLNMDGPTIDGLAERGRLAAQTMVLQFNESHYAGGSTGWDNHRWVRYRALLAGLPAFLRGYRDGREALASMRSGEPDPANPPVDSVKPPSYRLSAPGRQLGDQLSANLYAAADAVDAAPTARAAIRLRRAGRIRRIPDA